MIFSPSRLFKAAHNVKCQCVQTNADIQTRAKFSKRVILQFIQQYVLSNYHRQPYHTHDLTIDNRIGGYRQPYQDFLKTFIKCTWRKEMGALY